MEKKVDQRRKDQKKNILPKGEPHSEGRISLLIATAPCGQGNAAKNTNREN